MGIHRNILNWESVPVPRPRYFGVFRNVHTGEAILAEGLITETEHSSGIPDVAILRANGSEETVSLSRFRREHEYICERYSHIVNYD